MKNRQNTKTHARQVSNSCSSQVSLIKDLKQTNIQVIKL